jgi:methylthioribose-1-phosphate isomerase
MIDNIPIRLPFTPARWDSGRLVVLDQRRLPNQEEYITLTAVPETAQAIASLAARGAPLVGIVAAYGLCLVRDPHDDKEFTSASEALAATRPTAVNLSWAIQRMKRIRSQNLSSKNLGDILIAEACKIHDEDSQMCAKIGEYGNKLISEGANILTHCNTGALATGGIGTALGVIYTAHFSGKRIHVWVDETRPVLQGARLTAWELSKVGIPYTLIADNAAARLMADSKVDLVIVGADRVAANYDFANKVGTYGLAVLARYHGIPFYVAAPSSTFDPACPDGKAIVIEYRDPKEIRGIGSQHIAPENAATYNPAFDVTPHELVSGAIFESGIIRQDRAASSN